MHGEALELCPRCSRELGFTLKTLSGSYDKRSPLLPRRESTLQRVLWLALALILVTAAPARAIESIRVPLDAAAIDLTKAIERYSSQGDRLLVSTAPGSDGIVRRIEVRAREPGTHPSWIVFALTNDTDEQIERLIVAPHFRLVGSGVIWPDLGATRVSAITASQGFPPDRQESADADVFRLTLDPGTTVTYIAELRTPNLPQLYLWEPDAYKDKVTSLALYKGIVIGVAGLLALFLTIVFVVKGAVIFPAAAALAWAVLAYVCIDFGFWSKIFDTSRIYRSNMARRRRDVARRDAAGLSLRLSQSEPMACARLACRLRLACLSRRPRRPCRFRCADRGRRRAHLACGHRRCRLHPRPLSFDARLRPRGDADPDLVPSARLDHRRRIYRHRSADQ